MKVRTLSRKEAKVVLSLEAEEREVVSLKEIRRLAGGRISRGFARKIAHDLVRKGWLQRTRRGVYLLNPGRHGPDARPDTDPFRVGSRLADRYYFGCATAAELLGLLPQASRVYYLMTPTRRSSKVIHPVHFRWVYVSPRRFFGARRMVRRGVTIVASDVERTVLDCLNRPDLSGGIGGAVHVLAMAKPQLRWARLGRYLDRFGNRSLALRTGFLAERVRPSVRPPADWVSRLVAKSKDPYVPLGPPSEYGRRGPHDPKWHVIRNVSDAQLFAEVDLR